MISSLALIGSAAGPVGPLAAGLILDRWGVTADRGFSSFRAWQYASSTGAALLWRVQAGLHPHRLEDLDDGSWLAVITKPTKLRRSQKERLRADVRRGREPDPDLAVIAGGGRLRGARPQG